MLTRDGMTSARDRAGGWWRRRYQGSAVQDLIIGLRKVEFGSWIIMFGASFLLSVLPLIILLSALANSSKALVVDLTKVSFIASLGVRTLMVSAKTLIRRGADMAVCGANENVEKVLRSTGFDEIVPLYPDSGSASGWLTERLAAFASKKA